MLFRSKVEFQLAEFSLRKKASWASHAGEPDAMPSKRGMATGGGTLQPPAEQALGIFLLSSNERRRRNSGGGALDLQDSSGLNNTSFS